MKILLISNKVPFIAKDGGALAIYNLIKGVHNLDNDITILAMNTSKHFIDPVKFVNENISGININTVNINIDLKITDLIKNLIFTNKPYNLVRFINDGFESKLIRLLKKNTYDIIQLEGLYVCPYIETIRKNSDALIAYRSHNIESEIWMNNTIKAKGFFKKRYFHLVSNRLSQFETSIINRYDLLLPISAKDLDFFKANGNKKPSLIVPFGVDMADYNCVENEFRKNLFYIGSLDWVPNIEGLKWFVENVWIKLSLKYPELNFNVAGRNASPSLINFLKNNKVNFEGEIPDSKPFFCENDIMVVPLFSGSGMRVKIIEGMAYGKTIISTEKGAEGIEIKDNKEILIANNAESFMQNIEDLVLNETLFENIGSKARKLIETHYNNRKICGELVKFYKKHIK